MFKIETGFQTGPQFSTTPPRLKSYQKFMSEYSSDVNVSKKKKNRFFSINCQKNFQFQSFQISAAPSILMIVIRCSGGNAAKAADFAVYLLNLGWIQTCNVTMLQTVLC